MPAATTTSSQHPPNVPHYMVARAIGRGSYGEIWLAKSLTGAWRAVKIVERRRFEDTRAFEREFEGMAQFEPLSRDHPGFVDILHVGRSDDDAFFYYVMELADDQVQRPSFEATIYQPKTLKSELQRVARLPADEVVTLGLSLTAALAALHRNGLVHRDIKPANIIFCGGQPKIADIGLVSAMGQQSFVGTEGYVPPEGPGTVQADLYSLGKVLYEIAMGKDRLDFPEMNTRIAELPDRKLLLRVNEVLLRACNFDPARRYATADEMHEDLERVRDGRKLLRNKRGGRRLRLAPMAALLTVGAGAYAWWTMGPPIFSSAKGSAFIDSDPPGVRVMVDSHERRMFTTPAMVPDLPVGEHTARTFTSLYDKYEIKFTVAAGEEARPPKMILRRSIGQVRIASTPPGCEFELFDGEKIVWSGQATGEPKTLPTGEYRLVMKCLGATKERTIKVVASKDNEFTTENIEFVLRDFTIMSSPAGAEIFADGKPVGTAPCTVKLVEGSHQFSARYRKWPEKTLQVGDNHRDGIEFVFEPGSVKIISTPSGAEIFLGEVKIGETPHIEENLEPGEVTYKLRLAGYKEETVTTTVEPGKQKSATKRFESRPAPRRGQPWENSLGMKFVPVGDILVGIWPVRKSDYAAFAEEEGKAVVLVDFPQEGSHPVVRVNLEDATAFCEWLTRRELAANMLEEGQVYRLPTDAEWSMAAGMAPEGGNTPEQRDGINRELPWGKAWPPPAGSGNFADVPQKRGPNAKPTFIPNYSDGFPQTSPVGSFPPNKFGLFDMSGNVWQWVSDSYNERKDFGVLRGGSWGTWKPEELRLGYRDVVDRGDRDVIFGFRCVLVPER